jgi:hypothetical protein
MDFVLGFITGMLWYEMVVVGVLVFLSVLFMFQESVNGVFLGVVLLGSTYVMKMWTFGQIDWSKLISYVLIYIAIGIVWSMFKWYKLVRKRFLSWTSNYDSKNKDITFDKDNFVKPNISHYIDDIVLWILYFPFSIIAYISSDFFRNLVKKIVKIFGKVYDKISEMATH